MQRYRAGLQTAALFVLSSAFAQESQIARSQALPAADFMVPIHTAPPDPEGGAYGVWATGPGYKVSFHDGFAFYPFLGPEAPRHLPFRWRTRQVTAGGEPLFAAGAEPTHEYTASRYEYHYPAVVEAYDVRRDGVEQTFTISRRPAKSGDIVVVGEIDTELNAKLVELRHDSLTFADREGTPRLTYGAAYALDARGTKVDVETSFDGRGIELRVAADFVANATFPLVIDPLTSPIWIYGSPNPNYGPITHSDLEYLYSSPAPHDMIVVHSRRFTRSDVDCFAQVMDEDFSNRTTIFTDVTTGWSTDHPSATAVHNANSWVIAVQRTFQSPERSAIRVYSHPIFTTSPPNMGKTMFLSLPSGETHRHPQIGGNQAAGRPEGMVVYQVDKTSTNANTLYSDVMGVLADVKDHKFRTPFRLAVTASGTTHDRELPSVSRYASVPTSDYWIVVWQELRRTVNGDDWDIRVSRARSDGVGSIDGKSYLGSSSTSHKTRPKVDGMPPRFAVTYDRASPIGARVIAQRFDWEHDQMVPVKQTVRIVASSNSVLAPVKVHGIAYDRVTDSHWGILYTSGTKQLHAARVGYRGAVTEDAVHTQNGGVLGPAIAYAQGHLGFVLVAGEAAFLYPLYGRVFKYPADALSVEYGTGCGGKISAGLPYIGNEYFHVRLVGAKPYVPALLFMSLGTASIPYPVNSGCFLNVDSNSFVGYWAEMVSPIYGSAGVAIPLLDDPSTIGDFYFQWMHEDPEVSSYGWRLTRGLKVQIR